MSEENKDKIEIGFSPEDLFHTIGDWFKAKRIYYSDDMFYDYHNMAKEKISMTNELIDYLTIKIQEKVFQWLSVYHSKKKETYAVKEEDEELVPAWFLQERFKEIEMMLSSKFFDYKFTNIAMEFDSALKEFIVSLFTEKEMDDVNLGVLTTDINAYLSNQLTLLELKEAKLQQKNQIEITFSLVW